MKAIIFAALAAFSINASAESVNIQTELYRNGELVAAPFAITDSGSQRPFKKVEDMNFRELVGTNKARIGRLKLGTTAYFTPVVTSDGNFYVFNIDLSKGGEGTLTKQYS